MSISILYDIAAVFVWSLAGSAAMGVSLGLLLKIYDWMTPCIEEFEELKKGNISVAIVMAAIIIAFALIICVVLWPGSGMSGMSGGAPGMGGGMHVPPPPPPVPQP